MIGVTYYSPLVDIERRRSIYLLQTQAAHNIQFFQFFSKKTIILNEKLPKMTIVYLKCVSWYSNWEWLSISKRVQRVGSKRVQKGSKGTKRNKKANKPLKEYHHGHGTVVVLVSDRIEHSYNTSENLLLSAVERIFQFFLGIDQFHYQDGSGIYQFLYGKGIDIEILIFYFTF